MQRLKLSESIYPIFTINKSDQDVESDFNITEVIGRRFVACKIRFSAEESIDLQLEAHHLTKEGLPNADFIYLLSQHISSDRSLTQKWLKMAESDYSMFHKFSASDDEKQNFINKYLSNVQSFCNKDQQVMLDDVIINFKNLYFDGQMTTSQMLNLMSEKLLSFAAKLGSEYAKQVLKEKIDQQSRASDTLTSQSVVARASQQGHFATSKITSNPDATKLGNMQGNALEDGVNPKNSNCSIL